ncbi:MAG TPA: hypothetical protein DCQ28_07285 [Bacteroidetes bacterium]|nr:hypothetical protein [Bacteroidota bacterium]
MGSQTILDLISSTIVFGTLTMIALRLNGGTMENIQSFREDIVVQQNLVAVSELLEYDFRKIAYCKNYNTITSPTKAIRYADTSKIIFWTDFPVSRWGSQFDGNGVLDSLTYYVGPTSELADTPNPNDRLLYRVENNSTPRGVNLGVTTFNIQYYDAFRNKLTTPVDSCQLIQYLQITIQVEHPVKWTKYYNTATYDTVYQSAFWRQVRLVAKNLNNR